MNSRIISLLVAAIMATLLFKQLPSIKQLLKTIPIEIIEAIQEIEIPTAITNKEQVPLKKATPIEKIIEEKSIEQIDSSIPDFASIKDVKHKKTTFFNFMNKKVIIANKKVSDERAVLINLTNNHKDNQFFSEKETVNFNLLANKYRVNKTKKSIEEKLAQLKVKINQVPASLILAQSANESAWGTSRFAKKGNNYFGQWCFNKGCGLVPASRNSGASHEVAKFATVQKSVEAYIYNINVGRAYGKLRKLRAEMIANQQAVDSLQLATGLEKYSERGKEYVKEIQSMIRFNKLKAYDLQK